MFSNSVIRGLVIHHILFIKLQCTKMVCYRIDSDLSGLPAVDRVDKAIGEADRFGHIQFGHPVFEVIQFLEGDRLDVAQSGKGDVGKQEFQFGK